jgi:hypothetical protein
MAIYLDNVRIIRHPFRCEVVSCLTVIALNELCAVPGAFLTALLLEALLLNELPRNLRVPASV